MTDPFSAALHDRAHFLFVSVADSCANHVELANGYERFLAVLKTGSLIEKSNELKRFEAVAKQADSIVEWSMATTRMVLAFQDLFKG